MRSNRQLNVFDELIVDNFAGGGGASTGIELALGRTIDIAINHDAEAIAMHEANHPFTKHYCESVWDVDPLKVCEGKPVGLAWFSPDCRHFSNAKGSVPLDRKIRGLVWIALKWAVKVRPRVIMIENVPEFEKAGPLVNGRPCPINAGRDFRNFIRALQRQNYDVQVKKLVACDYGTPTTRKRLIIIARCDGQPIVWPEITHDKPDSPLVKSKIRKPHVPAASIIDWSLPMSSIFERKKPLADNTLERIAAGIKKFVINNPNPYIVTGNHQGEGFRGQSILQPFKTVTSSRDQDHLIFPHLIQSGYREREGQAPRVLDLNNPLGAVMAQGIKHAVAAATLIKNFGGNFKGDNLHLDKPLHTVTGQDHHCLVAANLVRQFGTSIGSDIRCPCPTVMPDGGGKTSLILSFLIKYYRTGDGQSLHEPLHTVTGIDTFALINVLGIDWIFADILYRMLEPPELYAAQGFPTTYIIKPEYKGKSFSKRAQVKMCGNSVPPPLAEALVRANYSIAKEQKQKYA